MKDIGKKIKKMGEESLGLKMELFLMENGKIIWLPEKEL